MLKKVLTSGFILFSLSATAQVKDEVFFKGLALAYENKYEKALEKFEAIEVPSMHKKAFYKFRGQCYYQLGKLAEARSDFTELNRLSPGEGAYGLTLCAAEEGALESVLEYLEKHLKSRFKKPQSEILLNKLFIPFENKPQWIEFWKNDWYNRYDDLLAEINYHIGQENYQKALNILDEQISGKNRKHQLFALRGEVLMKMNDPQNAIQDLDKAIQMRKSETSYYLLRAKAYEETGKYKKSLEDYEKALKLDPYDLYVYRELARMKSKTGDFDGAEQDITLYMNVFEDNSDGLYCMGNIFFENRKFLKALEYYGKYISAKPADYKGYEARGNTYMKTHTYQYAIQDFSRALDLKPSADIYLQKALALVATDDKEGACDDFQKAGQMGNKEALKYILQYCR